MSEAYRENSHPVCRFVQAYQGAAMQISSVLTQDRDDGRCHGYRVNILYSNLKDARGIRLGGGEDCAKIQVVRKYHHRIGGRKIHNDFVRGAGIPHFDPMNGLETRILENGDSLGRQLHVDQDLHAENLSGTSISSTRQATYASASSMSCGSR